MAHDTINIELTPAERSLLLRYGYPFAQIEQALTACSASKTVETVPMDGFEFERLIGDLSRSANNLNRGTLQDQLLALCDRLEVAEQYGDGTLDTF